MKGSIWIFELIEVEIEVWRLMPSLWVPSSFRRLPVLFTFRSTRWNCCLLVSHCSYKYQCLSRGAFNPLVRGSCLPIAAILDTLFVYGFWGAGKGKLGLKPSILGWFSVLWIQARLGVFFRSRLSNDSLPELKWRIFFYLFHTQTGKGWNTAVSFPIPILFWFIISSSPFCPFKHVVDLSRIISICFYPTCDSLYWMTIPINGEN